MVDKNGTKVEKETLAYWVDLSLIRALPNSNILARFRATCIWPLNLDKMEQKMGLSKPFYSIPYEKILVEEIMEDLPRGFEDERYYFVQMKGIWSLKKVLVLKMHP